MSSATKRNTNITSKEIFAHDLRFFHQFLNLRQSHRTMVKTDVIVRKMSSNNASKNCFNAFMFFLFWIG